MNNSNGNITVAIYTRVSTEEQKENFSLAAQLELLRKHASDNKYQVFEEYVDGGYSGTTSERPGLQKLLKDAQKKKFQLVLVYKLDRFFRNNRALLTVSDNLEKTGVGIKSVTEPFDTSNHLGKFILSLFGSLAQLERDTFMERSKMGRLRRAKEGYYSGTNPTKFGYLYNPVSRKLEINEKEAEVVKLVFKMYTEADSSLLQVARRLNELNYKTKEGHTFTSNTIHDIVRDPIYTGRWYANRFGRNGKLKPRGEWIEVPVPPVITSAIFEKAQDILVKRRNYTVRNVKYQYLLQGMMKCGDCGNSVSGTADKQYPLKNGKRYGPYFKLYYRCTHFVKNLYKKHINCRLRYMPGDNLESVVWNQVENILQNPSSIAKAIEYKEEYGPDYLKQLNKELSGIEARQNSLLKEDQRILEAYRHNIITMEQLEKEMNKIKDEKEILERRRNELMDLLETRNKQTDIKEAISCVEKVREGLQKFTFETKRSVLNFFQTRIIVNLNGIIDLALTIPKNLSESSFPSNSLNMFSWQPLQQNICWPSAD